MAAIGQLAAGIAHEIRNPLGIITNALYDLGETHRHQQPAMCRRICASPPKRWAGCRTIINNLLEFSRESGAELQSVDINDLLRKTLQLLNKGLQNGGIRVVTEFGALGACLANQNALRQIFLNLISNAVQAMPNGGELRLRTVPLPDGRIRLRVCRHGRRHSARAPQGHLQPVLHDQRAGAGHRPGAVGRSLGRRAVSRRDPRRELGRGRNHLQHRVPVPVRGQRAAGAVRP